MELKEAQTIADELIKELSTHFKKWLVCGSIRRRKEIVKDIDIVAIPKPESEYEFGEISLSRQVELLDPLGGKTKDVARFLNGPAIKRFQFKGISIDLYLANEFTFETLVLIRTGSTEHNVRLTKIARNKGLKLFASGKGLCVIKGGIYEPEEIIKTVENTEKGILMNLLGKIPEPQERRN